MEAAIWLGLGVAGTVLMVIMARRAWKIGTAKSAEGDDVFDYEDEPEDKPAREPEPQPVPESAPEPELATPPPVPPAAPGVFDTAEIDITQLERDARAARARLDAARMRKRRSELAADRAQTEPEEQEEPDTDEQEILDVASEEDEEPATEVGRRRRGGLIGRFLRR